MSDAQCESREEFESSFWFKKGVEMARDKVGKRELVRTAGTLRFGCWQQDALLAGYDSIKNKKAKALA